MLPAQRFQTAPSCPGGCRSASLRMQWCWAAVARNIQGAKFYTWTRPTRSASSPHSCRRPLPPAIPYCLTRACGQTHEGFVGCPRATMEIPGTMCVDESRGWSAAQHAACFCPSIGLRMSMCPCALCGARAARVSAMAIEPLRMAIVLLLCCYEDAPGQKRIPHLFCPRRRTYTFDPLTNSEQASAGWVFARRARHARRRTSTGPHADVDCH